MDILILFLLAVFFAPIALTLSVIVIGLGIMLLGKLVEDLDKS